MNFNSVYFNAVSPIESDTWYNLDYQWTTDLATAQRTTKLDLQSVALHELGHCIGIDESIILPEGNYEMQENGCAAFKTHQREL
ncbi:MAG: matrixin family metalloprotease [Methanothrix sp.]|nr:matrixin family metalloprotease [Methanothrix sp.]